MELRDIINIVEVLLLVAVFVFLFRFIFLNFSSRVQKPLEWVKAVKSGRISAALLQLEKKYTDRIRFYNIWLQISRINKEGIEGDLAELGVYKGQTARLMHLSAPVRKLHLFDTFEGFPADDLRDETGKAAGYTTQHFADTSLEKVKQFLGENQNIVFHKGYFPETAKGLENTKFALVSLDADLHAPTLAGLEFFYPRLADGGVIMIHDHNEDWPGLMKAVEEFCNTIPEKAIPVPDADSTVMIVKSSKH